MEPSLRMRNLAASSRICLQCLHRRSNAAPRFLGVTPRAYSSSTSDEPLRIQDDETARIAIPRWQRTPEGMSVPFRIRPKVKNNEWTCNSDPLKLDAMYVRLLGDGGDRFLSDETKWLAITHKSFDQGKRGFNDRLAYLGRRVVELQTSLALVASPESPSVREVPDKFNRLPFQHPQLSGLSNVTELNKAELLSKTKLSQLADQYGIAQVMRWRPKQVDNLIGSGIQLVSAQSLYAIIGAVSLERGAEVANRVVRERILSPLGIV